MKRTMYISVEHDVNSEIYNGSNAYGAQGHEFDSYRDAVAYLRQHGGGTIQCVKPEDLDLEVGTHITIFGETVDCQPDPVADAPGEGLFTIGAGITPISEFDKEHLMLKNVEPADYDWMIEGVESSDICNEGIREYVRAYIVSHVENITFQSHDGDNVYFNVDKANRYMAAWMRHYAEEFEYIVQYITESVIARNDFVNVVQTEDIEEDGGRQYPNGAYRVGSHKVFWFGSRDNTLDLTDEEILEELDETLQWHGYVEGVNRDGLGFSTDNAEDETRDELMDWLDELVLVADDDVDLQAMEDAYSDYLNSQALEVAQAEFDDDMSAESQAEAYNLLTADEREASAAATNARLQAHVELQDDDTRTADINRFKAVWVSR